MPYLSQRACCRAIRAVVSAVASLGTAILMPGIAHATGTTHPGGRVYSATTTITPEMPAVPTRLRWTRHQQASRSAAHRRSREPSPAEQERAGNDDLLRR
jgi:hypothetical protein